ncbi:zinc-binding dehydrogenase [Actinoplanes sp. NPDC051411]|uniref:alcohol dehydrogenase catalytic domain-containing protein n=1 Tax=Actinoplanes sp. NPDC051411 TaxID=3155522 RepID=UPI003430575A
MQANQVFVRSRELSGALELRTVQLPPPAAGEAQVRVEAAGVSYGDLLQQRGVIPGGPKPPFVPGFEVAGTVEAIGPGVTGVRPGQRVAALVKVGGYSSALNLPAERLVPLPAEVTAVDAAAVALNYFIAWQMLTRVAGVTSGDRILVHGASGGVGVAFLQLAETIGDVTVWGTASARNLDVVRSYGAAPIDYRTEDFVATINAAGPGLQAAFDPIGGPHFRRSYSLLARGGTMVGYGQNSALRNGRRNLAVGAAGFLGGIVAPKLVPDGRRTAFYNAWSLEKSQPSAYRVDLGRVLAMLSGGQIAPRAITVFPLAKVEQAFHLLEDGANSKIVLSG